MDDLEELDFELQSSSFICGSILATAVFYSHCVSINYCIAGLRVETIKKREKN